MADVPAVEAPAAPPAADTAPPQPGSDPGVKAVIDRMAGSDAFAALDALGEDKDDKGTPAPASPKPRDATGKFVPKPKETPPAPVAAAPKPPATTPAPDEFDKDGVPTKTPKLREHYLKLKADLTERENKYKAERADWEKQLAEARKGDPETTERLTKLQKDWEDAQAELRFTKYEASAEYKEKFGQPYVNAYTAGMKKTAALKVVERFDDSDPTNKVRIQEKRQGTTEDFDFIMSATDDETAAERAVQLFGEKAAPMILWHREQTNDKAVAAQNAIKEYREKGTAWEKERNAKMEAHQKRGLAMVEQMQAHAAEKFPQFFKPVDGDNKGNQLLEAGNHRVKRIIANGAPLAEGETQWSPEEFALEVAAYRNKAGAFDRVAVQVSQLRKENKELKAKLEAYEASEPGEGEGRREAPAPGAAATGTGIDGALSQLDKLAVEKAA